MKRPLFLCVFSVCAFGDHAVTLTWEDKLNPPTTTYSVYRAPGLCSGTIAWNKISSALPDKIYEDKTVTSGNYCYMVTATWSGVESAPSTSVLVPVPTDPPTKLTFTVR